MTPGERRFAQRLEALLEPDALCWYDVPVGTKYQHPDFVLLHPQRGILVLEVKDWSLANIQQINKVSVTLLTDTGAKEVANPLLQARQNAFGVKNALERDPDLRAAAAHAHAGKLLCPYGFGAVLSKITRAEFDAAKLGSVLEPHLVICRDEMTDGVAAEDFRERLRAMFLVPFFHVLTPAQVDRVRWHLFPELRIAQASLLPPADFAADLAENESRRQLYVMDLEQERLARSLGDGHRVIHGVAGSGKTLILAFRCEHLAKTLGKPILVLCYNVALAAKLEQVMAARGLGARVTVRNFHRWCAEQLDLHRVAKPKWNNEYPEALVRTFIAAVEGGQVPGAQYGAVLIDEGHDFEAEWLQVATRMVDPECNSLLLLYDDAQSIYGRKRPANFSFKRIGIQAQGRTTILRVNYRNTDEILNAAYAFARHILAPAEADEDGVPLLKPELAGRHGPPPQLAQFKSPKEEGDYIAREFLALHAQGVAWKQMAVLYRATFIADKIAAVLASHKIPVEWLRERHAKRFDSHHDSIKLMTMHSSKGLEFPVVAVAGLGFMPYKEDETADEARLLYVAMTRATERLLMTASRDSAFVRRLTLEQIAA